MKRALAISSLLTFSASSAAGASNFFDSYPIIVHFDTGSTRLSEQGRRVLDYVADVEREYPIHTWRLSAYTDRTGSDAFNRQISCRRSEVVRDYLIRAGVPARDLSIAVFGEMRFAVETPDGVSNRWNRRVEINVDAPGHQMRQTRDPEGRPTCGSTRAVSPLRRDIAAP